MIRAAGPVNGPNAAPSSDDARLRKACADMEGVFLAQLFAQLRETVPHDGIMDGGTGEEMFSAMMDEKVAAASAEQQTRGIGVALYHQLRAAIAAQAPEDGPPPGGIVPSGHQAISPSSPEGPA